MRTSAVGMAIAFAITAWSSVASAELPPTEVTDHQLAAAIQAREAFGLPADALYVRALMFGPADVGAGSGRFPMTAAEFDALAFPERARFVDGLKTDVRPYLQSLETFAGAWIDQRHGGRLVVMLTRVDSSIEAEISRLMPEPNRGFTIQLAPTAYSELERAYESAEATWELVGGGIPLLGYGIDERYNRLTVDVPETDIGSAVEHIPAMSSGLRGVDIKVVPAIVGRDWHCDTRRHCHDPLKAGVQIDKGTHSVSAQHCTLGFPLWVPDTAPNHSPNTQYLTAGHCGYGGSSNEWYHAYAGVSPTTNRIGAEKASLYGADFPRDIMRIGVTESTQMGTTIFGEASTGVLLTEADAPWVGEELCMSTGSTNELECGVVAQTPTSWLSETADPDRIVHGASMDTYETSQYPRGFTSQGGDSGAPIYRELGWSGGAFEFAPVGILDHERYPGCAEGSTDPDCYGVHDIYFANVQKALEIWGAEIWPD